MSAGTSCACTTEMETRRTASAKNIEAKDSAGLFAPSDPERMPRERIPCLRLKCSKLGKC